MSTRAIRTSVDQGVCDVCGRTLLRGERAEIYLSGGQRHSVCELCTSRALHDGWVREGEMPEYDDASSRVDRRRSLFGRLRRGRDRRGGGGGSGGARGRDAVDDFEPAFDEPVYYEDPGEPAAPPALEPEPAPEPAPRARPQRAPRARPGSPSWPEPVRGAAARLGGAVGREPRHVRAVPTSIEHRISSAVSLFNESEHPRTVAGIARSLGLPDVAVHPSDVAASQVNIVVSWELCWYRYEVELADEVPAVRSAAQGYELSELSEIERQNNARADERGRLELTR
ncbi:MAG TPA: hypothetical protein VFN87_10795 [Solirubrobacteraceae bacterium]|nr:hypothetical protein [Solirubrobacteraceae bacterium]